MACTQGMVTASVVLAMGWAMAGRAVEAQLAPPSLTLVVRDYGVLPRRVLERAKGFATRIFRKIDVHLNWRDAEGFAAEMETRTDVSAPRQFLASVVRVSLLSASMENPLSPPADTLGMANPPALRVSVLVPRIEHLTSRTGRDFGQVLGHVLAHEIGHLLLPPNSHSEAGIMAARLDLVRVENGSLWFDQHQALIIRARAASIFVAPGK